MWYIYNCICTHLCTIYPDQDIDSKLPCIIIILVVLLAIQSKKVSKLYHLKLGQPDS